MFPGAPFSLSGLFVLLTLVVVVAVAKGVLVAARSHPVLGAAVARKFLLLVGVWLLICGVLAGCQVFTAASMPPPLMLFMLAAFCAVLYFSFSNFGLRLAAGLPLWALVAFHIFRLPLELLMHWGATLGVVPQLLTYSGSNYDILTGVFALVLSLIAYRVSVPLRIFRVFNSIGLVLFVNVIVLSVLSRPTPFQQLSLDAPNIWVSFFPFIWLPTLLAPLALGGHLILLRRLVAEETARRAQVKPH
ncbi:MAG: hypothetical protein MK135_12705 [Polyangiaceae bacterium]|nr:hypothetical protein [Polyangiaceae bacterium]